MAETGLVIAGQGRSVTRTGGDDSWANPSRITADDGSTSDVEMTLAGDESHWLVADTFNLSSIPDGATILGVTARLQVYTSGTGDRGDVIEVVIGKNDSTLGTIKTPNSDINSQSPLNYDYGGASDLWGLSLTAAEVKASTFQFRIATRSQGGTFRTHHVDAMWVNVTYLPATNGTASITEAADTVSATGVLSIQGVASITQADDTLEAIGIEIVQILGEADITEEGDTLTSTGVLPIVGTANLTEDDDTLTATGVLPIAGTAAITEEDDTVASAGVLPIQGTADLTEEPDSVSSAGVLPIQGTASVTEEDDAVSSAGVLPIVGVASITEEDDSLAAAGVLPIVGEASLTEEDDSLAATGVLPIVGTLAVEEDPDSFTSTGALLIQALLDITEEDDVVSFSETFSRRRGGKSDDLRGDEARKRGEYLLYLQRKKARREAREKAERMAADEAAALLARYGNDDFVPFPLDEAIAQREAEEEEMITALMLAYN